MTKKIEKKSAWTKVEPLKLDKKKKYVVRLASPEDPEPDVAVMACENGAWVVLYGEFDEVVMTDVITYFELPE